MSPTVPTIDELAAIAAAYHMHPDAADLAFFRETVGSFLESYARLDSMTEPALPVRYPRTPGYRPRPDENPLCAWYWRSEIQGAASGPLQGKTLAIKDNVCVAGVPMMNGTAVLEGYVPEVDATVVTRILDAGGTILGKAVCEALCFSIGSHTSDTGPVRNPHDPERSTGGSSSGSAALVAAGEVDMAIGGDQGGSIRIPSAWCGIYGLKPTYGLVPYTGCFPIELTLDHVGPMARTVHDVALLLEVIAGPDSLDPRQREGLTGQPYTQALSSDVRGLRIGVLEEGFDIPGMSEPEVDGAVREAAHAFERLGAQVEPVSIPLHREGPHIWNVLGLEGATALMVAGNAMGTNWKGYYTTPLLEAFARGRISQADLLPDTVKVVIYLGQHIANRYHGRYYARARNVARTLAAAYNSVLRDHDLLALPTFPTRATHLPASDATREECLAVAWAQDPNCCPFNITGHPAMNVPCGMADGLPVGMMLVGRIGEDGTVLRAGHAFEQRIFAAPVPPSRIGEQNMPQ